LATINPINGLLVLSHGRPLCFGGSV